MKHKLRYFGERKDLENRLIEAGYDIERFLIKTYALDSSIEFEAKQSEGRDICEALGEGLYSEDNSPLSQVLVDFLKENGLTIATAESCTGGLVAARIVDAPGASDVLHEGVVTYSNEAKIERLGVSEETLAAYGAVSEETAKEMALGLLNGNVDMAVSTTGIAGPGGGSEEKPVGLVYICIAFQGRDPVVLRRVYSGTRNEIRRSAANEALYRMYEYLFENL